MSLGRDLAYVALVVSDTDTTAQVLGRELGLKRNDLDDGTGQRLPVFAIGESALALFPQGHPGVGGETRPGVHHIALGIDHIDDGLAVAEKAGVSAFGKPETGLGGRRRVALSPDQTAGIKTWLTERVSIDRAKAPLIERLDHLGIASADNQTGIAAWSHRLGCPIESQQTDMEVMIPVESFTSDKHGVVYHSRAPIPVGGLRVAFITVGDTDLEFLQNFNPQQRGVVDHGSAGTTRQDQGAIAKFVASRGPGLHHVAMKTPDINAVLRGLDAAGVPVIDKKGRPGSRAGLIGFVHPKGTGGVLFHFDERPG
ncbi:VOC family protein [Hyphomicrobium sp. CS1BSMeth3]|uniref:VOC family protein n=1 Tax=Hyphomicrobium sp. CS1BSMeth3 TaxID=1892844 RepID=UPI0009FA37BF|nr:VOC family protein [Hyphomicrobium sp. CS1BSMeth3]